MWRLQQIDGDEVRLFREKAFVICRQGLNGDCRAELERLSQAYETAARDQASSAGKSWGDCGLQNEKVLAATSVVIPEVQQIVDGLGLAQTWSKMIHSLAYPQLAYSFQAKETGIALGQHTDGADGDGVGQKVVGQYEVLLGALIGDVPNKTSGAFLYWPGSHAEGHKSLKSNPDAVLWDAIRQIPNTDTEPEAFTGIAGDVILVHRLLKHATARRLEEGARRMVFFRLGHRLLDDGVKVSASTFGDL